MDEEIESSTLQNDNITIHDGEFLPPRLLRMSERGPDTLGCIAVLARLTDKLPKFREKQKFAALYPRQTTTKLTREHSCLMIKALANE